MQERTQRAGFGKGAPWTLEPRQTQGKAKGPGIMEEGELAEVIRTLNSGRFLNVALVV